PAGGQRVDRVGGRDSDDGLPRAAVALLGPADRREGGRGPPLLGERAPAAAAVVLLEDLDRPPGPGEEAEVGGHGDRRGAEVGDAVARAPVGLDAAREAVIERALDRRPVDGAVVLQGQIGGVYLRGEAGQLALG